MLYSDLYKTVSCKIYLESRLPWTSQSAGATRLVRFLQITRSSGYINISFNLSRVYSFSSSNHCFAGIPRDHFLSAFYPVRWCSMVRFALVTSPNLFSAISYSVSCVLHISCVSPRRWRLGCVVHLQQSSVLIVFKC